MIKYLLNFPGFRFQTTRGSIYHVFRGPNPLEPMSDLFSSLSEALDQVCPAVGLDAGPDHGGALPRPPRARFRGRQQDLRRGLDWDPGGDQGNGGLSPRPERPPRARLRR